MVSIILSNYNTPLHFLKKRVASIINQTIPNWECIIIDGFSTNESWEYLISIAKYDTRFILYQFTPNGIYDAWNKGIKLSNYQYVYIAPSDDTMREDCLEKLSTALDSNSTCDIASCLLHIINEDDLPSQASRWEHFYPFQFFGETLFKSHIRNAPYDGILHCGLLTVYTSITQILIKKKVFETAGYFLIDKGSTADLEWGMRAGLIANIIHIPEYLATWRRHDQQATKSESFWDPKSYNLYKTYIDLAFKDIITKGLLNEKYFIKDLKLCYSINEFTRAWINEERIRFKILLTLKYFIKDPLLVSKLFIYKIIRKAPPHNISIIKSIIYKLKLENHLVFLSK